MWATIIGIALICVRNDLSLCKGTAIATVDPPGKRMDSLTARSAPAILVHQTLNNIKFGTADDSLVSPFYARPFAFIFVDDLLDLIVWGSPATLHQDTAISLVGEDSHDSDWAPFCFPMGLEAGLVFTAAGLFILRGSQDAHLVELGSDFHRTQTLDFPSEDHPHNIGCKFINEQFVFILGVANIAVNREVSDKLAAVPLVFQIAADLDGNIAAVRVVDEVFEGDDKAVTGAVCRKTIVMVVDGNKTNAFSRKQFLNVLPGVNILTTETR